MKLCYIGTPTGVHSHSLVKGLLSRGHEVTLLGYGPADQGLSIFEHARFRAFSLTSGGDTTPPLRSAAAPKTNTGRVSRSLPNFGRSVLEEAYALYVGYGTPPPPERLLSLLSIGGQSYLMRLETYAARAARIIAHVQPDLTWGSFLTNSGYIAARTGFRPLLTEAQGDDVLIRPTQSMIMKMILRHTIRKSDHILSPANCITDNLRLYAGHSIDHKVTSLPVGVNLQVFSPDPTSRNRVRQRLGWLANPILIMTRFFEPIYGIEYFIDALPRVLDCHPEVRVIIVGDGSLENELRERVSRLGLNEYLFFAGRIDHPDEMAAYLNGADVYVSSSLSDGSSCALREAMACALPVVVSDAPGNLEWVADPFNGSVVPRRDAPALAAALISILGQESRWKEMGRQNRKVAYQADWERNLTRIENICNSLIASRLSEVA